MATTDYKDRCAKQFHVNLILTCGSAKLVKLVLAALGIGIPRDAQYKGTGLSGAARSVGTLRD